MEGMKKIKSMSFHQYSWNSEVKTTSLIGWHHKTSSKYYIRAQLKLVKMDKISELLTQFFKWINETVKGIQEYKTTYT